ncbi:MAG: cytochrome c3 family protein [Chloroflexi bacterium]|nr:cytochrome c3 family protein [Chloroflexota bacterium]
MSLPKAPLAVKVLVPVIGLVIGIGGLIVTVGILKAWWSTPFGPAQVKASQPIKFRHDLHIAAEIDCQYCHREALKGEAATIPSVQLCVFCHQVVLKTSPEITKLLSVNESGEPLNWGRVHRLPDHVQFLHEAHVAFFSKENKVQPSQVCSICHGDVGKMQVAEQVRNLKMRDCVDCHRGGYFNYLTPEAEAAIKEAITSGQRRAPPSDCATCHY